MEIITSMFSAIWATALPFLTSIAGGLQSFIGQYPFLSLFIIGAFVFFIFGLAIKLVRIILIFIALIYVGLYVMGIGSAVIEEVTGVDIIKNASIKKEDMTDVKKKTQEVLEREDVKKLLEDF